MPNDQQAIEQDIIDYFSRIRDQFTRQDILSEWAQAVESSILRNFVVGGRYSLIGSWLGGQKKWKPLAASTIRARKRQGYYPIHILRRQSLLMNSIAVRTTSTGILMTASQHFPHVHQYGARIKATKRGGGGTYEFDIPARPFLVIQPEDIDELRDIILDRLR